MSRVFPVRSVAQLPFYCDPLKLFLGVWLMMLASLQLHISYTTYPGNWVGVGLFAASMVSFLMGYLTVRSAYSAIRYQPKGPTAYRIDVTRLRRFHILTYLLMAAIVVMNAKLYGPPPIFGFFGYNTLDYQEYGSLRQVLFPAIMILFVSAPLESAALRRWTLYCSGVLCMGVYMSRGYLLIMLFQALIVFSLRTTLSKRKIYAIAILTLCGAAFLSDAIGNSRNTIGSEALLGYMQIKRAYYDWPTSYLWIVSYVSTPISNMCWIVTSYAYKRPTGTAFYSMLPGFWAPKSLEISDLGNGNIVDGVHTYLAKYYLDFWYLGIFLINYAWGLISGLMAVGNRVTRNFLVSAALLGCIGFIFFADFLTILIILLELAGLGVVQRYCTTQLSLEG